MVGSLLLLLLLAVLGCPAAANPNGLGMTPPMGWRATPPHSPCCDSPSPSLLHDRILPHLAVQGALDFTIEAQAPTYFALDLDGSSTTDDANNLVGQAGPYVVKVVGPDDRGTEQTRTKYKLCEASSNCYFSTTEMFTLKPSSECATALP